LGVFCPRLSADGGLVTQQPWLCNGMGVPGASFGRDKSVARGRKPLVAQAIDNNPTPSYLSRDLG